MRLLRNYPESIDLSTFALEDFAEEDALPAGVLVPGFWGAPPGGTWTFRSFKEGQKDLKRSKKLFTSGVCHLERSFIDHLCHAYASTLSSEHQHIDNPIERRWLEHHLESGRHIEAAVRREALQRLLRASTLEHFLGEKFPKAKRFGLKGCEALLPALWALTEQANELGIEQLQLGMAHRGRLNVLVNYMGKRLWEVCSEFGEQKDFLGDLKYHLGTRGRCRET